MAKKLVKCKDCRYLHQLPDEFMRELEHDYCYICIIPALMTNPDFNEDSSLVEADMWLMNKKGINEEIKCKYFKGWDA